MGASQSRASSFKNKRGPCARFKGKPTPAAIAELCWSDDPDYITGYVAGKKMGYQRITAMKEYGTEEGCRVFFIDGSNDVNTYIHDLEKQPILIEWEEDHDS